MELGQWNQRGWESCSMLLPPVGSGLGGQAGGGHGSCIGSGADPLPEQQMLLFQRGVTLSVAWTGCHTSPPSSLHFPTRAAPPHSSSSPPDPMLESVPP